MHYMTPTLLTCSQLLNNSEIPFSGFNYAVTDHYNKTNIVSRYMDHNKKSEDEKNIFKTISILHYIDHRFQPQKTIRRL